MEVAFIPYWGTLNPYQDLLGKSLEPLGVNIKKLESFGAGVTQGELNDIFYKIVFGRLKVNILHIHWLPSFSTKPVRLMKLVVFVVQLLIIRIIGVRIVWTVHNLIPHESSLPKGDRMITNATARIAHAIIVHNKAARTKLITTCNLKQQKDMAVIPHGNFVSLYDNTIGREEARSRLGIADSKFVVLFLGRIRPYKGILQLIDIFKKLRREGLDMELIIAGRPLGEKFSNVVRDSIAGFDGVCYKPGFVPQDEIQVFMNASEVAVFPYRDILTSGAVILAMSYARTCIAPKLGFTEDVLDDKGAFLYDPGEKDGLLIALTRAYASRPSLTDMGRYNFRKVLPWNWDFIASETNKVYCGLH